MSFEEVSHHFSVMQQNPTEVSLPRFDQGNESTRFSCVKDIEKSAMMIIIVYLFNKYLYIF
jgi:hypothetical protein